MPFNIKDIFKDNSGRGHFDSEALNENFLQYYQRLYLKQKQPSAWVLGNCHFENVIIIIFFFEKASVAELAFSKVAGSWPPTLLVQKQPPEVFYKKTCSQKFHKIHRKTPVPESVF